MCRLMDQNIVGGQLLTVASTVMCEGKPVVLHPSQITPHTDFTGIHNSATTTQGSSTIIVEGRPVVYVGAGATCGHSIATGSLTVFVSP